MLVVRAPRPPTRRGPEAGSAADTHRWVRLALVATALLTCARTVPAAAQDGPAAILYTTQSRLDRVAAYRVRDNGRVESQPFHEFDLGSGSNPRRVVLHPRGCALYVATANRLEVLRILPDNGSLARFDDGPDTMRRMRFVKPANFQYVAVHPDGNALYTSLTAVDQVQQYALNADGSLQRTGDPGKDPPIVSCVQSVQNMRHQGLGVTATHLYASAHAPARIDIFSLDSLGRIQSLSERPDHDDNGGEEEPEAAPECDRQAPRFAEAFSGSLVNPKALILDPAGDTVYVADLFRLRIYSCPIAPDGTLPDCPRPPKGEDNELCPPDGEEDSDAPCCRALKSKQSTFYEQLALSDTGVLFASVFREGRVRAFLPDCTKGRLNRRKRKVLDIFSTPGGLVAAGDLLYVAQGDKDRIEVFPIDDKGFTRTTPMWQTDKIKKSFPNDVALLPWPIDATDCMATTTTSAVPTTTTSVVSTSTTSVTIASSTTTSTAPGASTTTTTLL